jgi:hypothetical protein
MSFRRKLTRLPPSHARLTYFFEKVFLFFIALGLIEQFIIVMVMCYLLLLLLFSPDSALSPENFLASHDFYCPKKKVGTRGASPFLRRINLDFY